ncbi:hypothetical protein ACEPAH_6405 [Sanghuangporus vaninii]
MLDYPSYLSFLSILLLIHVRFTGALYIWSPEKLYLLKRAVAYYDPAAGGGSMLTNTGNGLGEPLNIIISALSSPDVLTDRGFLKYAQSIGFDKECLNIHIGNPQSANLGDGNGWVNQTILLREDYGIPEIGTCLQSLVGGNHFRLFRQNGPTANSGALFLAVSHEENAFESHTISPDGYNRGRDELVSLATRGQTSSDEVTYSTTSEDVSGLLVAGATGINHGIAIDGIVKVLMVTIV